MQTHHRRLLTTGGTLVAAVALVASLAPASTAGSKKWHIVNGDTVAHARLSRQAFHNIDPDIKVKSVRYRKGGEGNVEVCGYVRTERISVSRKANWKAGDRFGRTLIMQYRKVSVGKPAFKRLKRTYLNCTPATFGYKFPDRVTVGSRYLVNKRQVRLRWVIYTSAAHTEVKRAEALAVSRAGGALIVTRSINREGTKVRPKMNGKLTKRQFEKYRDAARY